jgi:hypothetical protein
MPILTNISNPYTHAWDRQGGKDDSLIRTLNGARTQETPSP